MPKLRRYRCSECNTPMDRMPFIHYPDATFPKPIGVFQCNKVSPDPEKESPCIKLKFRLFVFDAPVKPLVITSHELRHAYPFARYYKYRMRLHKRKLERRIAEVKHILATKRKKRTTRIKKPKIRHKK